jgi:peptide/nickel transport system permease protein
MGLKAFLAKRIVYSFILLLAVICVNFVIFILMPGDPSQFLIPLNPEGGVITQEQRAERERILAEAWGYGESLEIQLIKYIRNLLTGQFGKSWQYKSDVGPLLASRIPFTLIIIGGSTVISIIIGVVLGVLIISKRGSILDSGAVISSLILGALPTFWLGLIFLLVFYVNLNWFPNAGAFPREWAIRGYPQVAVFEAGFPNFLLTINGGELLRLLGGYVRHAFLPVFTLVVFSFGSWLIYTRAVMLDAITEDYVITARAKGLNERTVMFKHALKNAALPLITSAALAFGFVLGGAMITEAVYTYPGVGRFTFEAIGYQDYAILMAVFYVISLCVITANIIADLFYGIIDPRVRYG